MPWPNPALVLYVLGSFLVGYGISLAVRASAARRWRGVRDVCAECRRAWPVVRGAVGGGEPAAACAACGARPPAASAVRAATLWSVGGVLVSIAGVGVFLFGLVVAGAVARELGRGSGPGVGPILGGGMGVSLFGLYLVVAGWRGQRSGGRRRCPKCWYLIDEALGTKCSECGHEARREKDLFRPRRRMKVAVLGVMLVALGQAGWVEGRVRRGGWLAAVPTEVLILGMPWVPDAWLVGGVSGADEDWSLGGRFSERRSGAAWGWHRPWAVRRASRMLESARTTTEAELALSLLVRVATDRDGAAPVSDADAGLAHAVRLAVAGLADPSDASAFRVLSEVYGHGWVYTGGQDFEDPPPKLAAAVREATPALLPLLEQPLTNQTMGSTFILGMGDGSAEVVEALLDAGLGGHRGAPRVVGTLALRHEHVREQLRGMVEDASEPRRAMAVSAITAVLRMEESPELERAVAAAMDDADPSVALAAAESLWWARSEEHQLAAFDAMVRVLTTDPTKFERVLATMEYRLEGVLPARRGAVLGLARSDDPEVRRFFVALVLSQGEVDAEVAREAVRLIDAGVEVSANVWPGAVEALRERAKGSQESGSGDDDR